MRVVRPHNHVGPAYGGDRLKLDASELRHPALARALWTEEEAREAQASRVRALEQRFLRDVGEGPSEAMRAADAQFAAAIAQRNTSSTAARPRARSS